jgi:hypothetical protein
MSSNNKKYQYTDSAGFIHYMPENTAIPIEEAARIYHIKEHETGKTYIVKEEPEQKPLAATATKPEPKEKSTAELMAEVDRLYKKEFPVKQEQKPQSKINEIKRLSRLLQRL